MKVEKVRNRVHGHVSSGNNFRCQSDSRKSFDENLEFTKNAKLTVVLSAYREVGVMAVYRFSSDTRFFG